MKRLFLVVLAVLAGGGAASPPESGAPKWLRVEYASLVDGRKLTHSGEPVGALLRRLGGRGRPPAGTKGDDALALRLLDPVLEPYAFVLSDALDSLAPPPDPPLVEVGSLWEPGEEQPAWVELVRARRYVLESDGEGTLRVCLPASALDALPYDDALPTSDPVATAKEAWEQAWPVLRHALAGERRRLSRALTVEVHAYRHLPSRNAFVLGVPAWRTTVDDTSAQGGRATLDLAALRTVLDRGLQIEGARLDRSGRVRWFTSEPDAKPAILGRAPALSDLAVAYRAIAHGGEADPYMSLDKDWAPHSAVVNYGGRLRDTALGMVSLLSDIRFKTLSQGIDVLAGKDARGSVRETLPGFKTHLERFAADPSAGAVLNQQTRFWFYPDDVDLTLSAEGDVLAFRRVRMTAASERVAEARSPGTDPAWTRETVAFVNEHFDELGAHFPELSDLDETARLLALFTWLTTARDRGLAVPDLDVLLALPLPALPTPRRFPQLLTHDAIPPPGGTGIVDVLDRTEVGDALERLEPVGGKPLAAQRRLARTLAMLSPQIPDQAAIAAEIRALPADADALAQDAIAFRAERLLMHARVLASLPAARREAIETRRGAQPGTRVFSVGIGGIDLGMRGAISRASERAEKKGSDPGRPAAAPVPGSASSPKAAPLASSPPPEMPVVPWPDHGLGPAGERQTLELPDGKGKIVSRRRPGSLVRRGSWKVEDGTPVPWEEWLLGMEGPELRSRRRFGEPSGKAPVFERIEDGRFLSYRLDRAGTKLTAARAARSLPPASTGDPSGAASPDAAPPEGLVLLDLPPADGGEMGDAASIRVRLRGADGGERIAALPRPLLQRLVLGRDADALGDRPLAAFTPPSQALGTAQTLMALASPEETRAPWTGPAAQRPGEENARRLAAALTRWWSAEPGPRARAVCGVDPAVSPARWARVPKLEGAVAVLAPDDAFPGATSLREGLAGLPADVERARVVLLVSAEPPGILGRRLRALAADPRYAGKALAVAALGGALREDLPASLLAEGKLAVIGLAESGPLGLARAAQEAAAWARSASQPDAKGKRPEELPGPFIWIY